MTIYTWQAAQKLINSYAEKGDDVWTIPGSLCDSYICEAPGYKFAIIKEVYLSAYSSGVTVRFYNHLPKKYEDVISLLCDEKEEKASRLFYAV